MRNNSHNHILADLAPDNAYRRGVLMGIGYFCHEREDVDMLTIFPEEAALTENPKRIDGIITTIRDAVAGEAAANRSLPMVNVSSMIDVVACPTVCTDNQAIGRLAAEHLLEQGYTHFAYHLDSRIAFSRQRLEGFASRLEEAGYASAVFDTSGPAPAGNRPPETRSATAAWLHGLVKPVGVFTHNDERAYALIEICRRAGIEVPNEVGIIGSDNDDVICSVSKPTLTSIDNASNLVGYRAASVVLDLVDGVQPLAHRETVLPRRVVERESTQPAFVHDETLRQAMRFIRAHATDRISVDDVVRHVSLSRRTLERRFQTHLARSPGDEIRRVQIERARFLLSETRLELSEVAIASGYSRFTSFATAFLAVQAQTPKQYREAFRTR